MASSKQYYVTADGERPAVVSYVKNGELKFGKVTFCKDYESSADVAIEKLLAGQRVKLQQIASLFSQVQRGVDGALRERVTQPKKEKNVKAQVQLPATGALVQLEQREWNVLSVIIHYASQHGITPTHREIMAACGLSSTSVVADALSALCAFRLIRMEQDKARTIRVCGGRVGLAP